MDVRLVGGQWLLVGDLVAVSSSCCCGGCVGDCQWQPVWGDDGLWAGGWELAVGCLRPEVCNCDEPTVESVGTEDAPAQEGPYLTPCEGPPGCADCADSCVCVVLHGHNFCDGEYYELTDCGSPAASCTQEVWQQSGFVSPFSSAFYGYTKTVYGPTDENFCTPSVSYTVGFTLNQLQCVDGQWTGITFLNSAVQEATCDDPPVKSRGWSYSPAIVADSNGCPESVNNGEYTEDFVFEPSSIDPLPPDITFLPCPPPEEEMEPMAARELPGTELKALLSKIGITASPTCSCNKRARVMDEKGCDWCEQHIDEIDGWLAEEARKRGLPYLSLAGKTLIRLAVRRARKKGNN